MTNNIPIKLIRSVFFNKYLISVILLKLLFSNLAFANIYYINPYISLNCGMKYIGFKENQGIEMFKKNYPLLNVTVGLELLNRWDLEFYLEATTTRTTKDSIYETGSIILNSRVPATLRAKSSSKFYGIGLNLIYRCLLLNNDNLFALFGAGIKQNTASLSYNGFFLTTNDQIYRSLYKYKTKIIPKLIFGLNYRINNRLAWRTLISWENTAKLFPQHGTLQAALKNTWNYTVGIVVNL